MQTHVHKYTWRTPVFALSQSKGTSSSAVMSETSPVANASFLFLNRAGRKVIMNLGVAEVSPLAVLIVITCTAPNVKIIQDRTIFIFCSDGEEAEVSKKSLQHINSCLEVSCWHNTLFLKIPKGEGITGHKGDPNNDRGDFWGLLCHMCGACSPWHLRVMPAELWPQFNTNKWVVCICLLSLDWTSLLDLTL